MAVCDMTDSLLACDTWTNARVFTADKHPTESCIELAGIVAV